MRIIPIDSSHISALSALAGETFSETFGHLYPPQDLTAFLTQSYAVPKLLSEVEDPRQFWRIVLDEAHYAIAYLHCGPVTLPHPDADPAREGEVKRIYVRASHQGRGLGKRLLDTAMDHLAQTYGDAAQWIGVWNGNLRAQALYASYGFEKVGGYIFPVGDTQDDEYILRRIPA